MSGLQMKAEFLDEDVQRMSYFTNDTQKKLLILQVSSISDNFLKLETRKCHKLFSHAKRFHSLLFTQKRTKI